MALRRRGTPLRMRLITLTAWPRIPASACSVRPAEIARACQQPSHLWLVCALLLREVYATKPDYVFTRRPSMPQPLPFVKLRHADCFLGTVQTCNPDQKVLVRQMIMTVTWQVFTEPGA